MRRSIRVLAAIGLLVAAATVAAMPPAPEVLPTRGSGAAPVRGAMHVHTTRSDGSGTLAQVAAAAARAGLSFVIVTDHGDASRDPDPPRFVDGVLMIDAVEISTDGGHVVALGLPRAPYPLAGAPAAVLEDIARLGGMSIAAHPTSAKESLAWRDWDLPFDGLEWLNGDSEWRDERLSAFPRLALTYWWRPGPTLVTLLDRPVAALRRWDALAAARQTVGLAGADAHARLGLSGFGEPYESSAAVHLPGYEATFRAFSISLPGLRLTEDPVEASRLVIDAIRAGRVFTTIDAIAGPASLSLVASSADGRQAEMGGRLETSDPVTITAHASMPSGATLVLYVNGAAAASSTTGEATLTVDARTAAYRAEVHTPDSPGSPPIPWVVSNPVYVNVAKASAPAAPPVPVAPADISGLYDAAHRPAIRVEQSADSKGAVDETDAAGGGRELMLRFALGGRRGDSPFVALVLDAGQPYGPHRRLAFTGRAERPMRVSVQLRATNGRRWQTTAYLDPMPRRIDLPLVPLRDAERAITQEAPRDFTSVLFVVDSVNTQMGESGRLWVSDVSLTR